MSDVIINLSLLIEELKTMESFSSKTYLDAKGVKTIGYGFTQSKYVNKGVITKQQADKILRDLVVGYYEQVCVILDKYGYKNVPLHQLVALTSFTYNCGIGNLKMLTGYGTRDLKTIGAKITAYNKCGGKVLKGLVTRRKWEQDLFNNKYKKFKY